MVHRNRSAHSGSRHTLREGNDRLHGRRSEVAPGASAEPARATAGWRRLRPSDKAERCAAGPGKDWQRPPWLAARRPARWSNDTSSKSNERLEIGRFLIRIINHSFRGLITAALPPFPGLCLPKPSNLNFICDHRITRPPSSTGDGFNCVSPFHVCEDISSAIYAKSLIGGEPLRQHAARNTAGHTTPGDHSAHAASRREGLPPAPSFDTGSQKHDAQHSSHAHAATRSESTSAHTR